METETKTLLDTVEKFQKWDGLLSLESEYACKMDDITLNIIISLSMSEMENKEFDALKDDDSYRLFDSRLSPDTKVTHQLKIFCAWIGKGIPGRLVMLAHCVSLIHNRIQETVGIGEFSNHFPIGSFPNDEGYNKVWDDQKCFSAPFSNALDMSEWWLR